MNWQPMETAPKDGTPVLLYGKKWEFDWQGSDAESFCAVCSYMGLLGWSIDKTVYYTTTCLEPVAWMHLPEPPKP